MKARCYKMLLNFQQHPEMSLLKKSIFYPLTKEGNSLIILMLFIYCIFHQLMQLY